MQRQTTNNNFSASVRRSYFVVFVTLSVGVTTSLLLWQMVSGWEQTLRENEFQKWSMSYVSSLQKELDRYSEVLESTAALYISSSIVERREFQTFSKGLLKRHIGIQALEWIPRVIDNKRKLFEQNARNDGFKDFHITERQNQSKMVPASQRKEYYPVYFVEPFEGNEQALGFDLASNPIRLAALEQARDTGKMVTTARITLVQESASQFGFLIFKPIYREGSALNTVQQRRENLQGYILGVFRIGEIIQASLNMLEDHKLNVTLLDKSAKQDSQILYTSVKQDILQAKHNSFWRESISIPDREWSLYLTPQAGFYGQYNLWQSWLVLSSGLLFTGLLAWYLAINHRRTMRMENMMLASIQAETKLRLSAKVLENTPEGIMITDNRLKIISINPAFIKTTGYIESEAIGQTPKLLHSGRHKNGFYKGMWDILSKEGQWQGEIWNRRKNGEIYPEWLNISAIYDEAGQIEYYTGIFSDLSTQEHIRTQMHKLAYYDALTDLPNRELFNDRLQNSLVQTERGGGVMALLFLDLDRFKMINDSLGHGAGDELLIGVAKLLNSCTRKSDTVARLGGDEFTLILNQLESVEDAAMIADKIISLFAKPFYLTDKELFVTTSIGISLFPSDGSTAEILIKNADTAMYRAKEKGRNDYQFYKPEMSKNFKDNLALSNDLRQALEKGELHLVYQPQIDLLDNTITGMEALLRWEHPKHGSISPVKFIPIAEEHGLINEIGMWVLFHSCQQAKTWFDMGFEKICMAVNISGHQIKGQDTVKQIKDVLFKTGLKPNMLELELTEGVLMENTEPSIQVLDELKALGVYLAIDDFGTGYSSLSYLKRFPIDKLKIDKSFIDDVTYDEAAAAIASTIITMGNNLHLKVIAEGVENNDQLNFLKKHHCDEMQGYLFSKPINATEMTQLLQTHKPITLKN